MKAVLKKISANIRKYKKNLSLKELAVKAGISPRTLYSVYYNQENDIKLSTVIAIAKALGVSIDKLID
jgi:transcriptional regulator with XRE-family HTH domain